MATTPQTDLQQTGSITFAEFERLPASPGLRVELRHGEVVQVPPAKWQHFLLQERLRNLLAKAAGSIGRSVIEMPFRPLQEHEYRIADVALVSQARWNAADPKGYFNGAPDIVIEILSPSNTVAEMLDKEKLCLENGSREFWLVDPDRQQVKVSTPDGQTLTYRAAQNIPLAMTQSAISVDAIFASTESPAEG